MFVTLRTGYCGMDARIVMSFPDDMSEDDMCEEMWCEALQNAESYGIEMCSDECEDHNCELQHPGSTSIEYSFEPYVPKKHDSFRAGGGGTFMDDIEED